MIESLSSELMAHLWQSTLVIGVVWLMTLALRGNRARVRYWLWTAASLKFLVPFSWLVRWRTVRMANGPSHRTACRDVCHGGDSGSSRSHRRGARHRRRSPW